MRTADFSTAAHARTTRATVPILSIRQLGSSVGRILPSEFEVYPCGAGLAGLHAFLALEYKYRRVY